MDGATNPFHFYNLTVANSGTGPVDVKGNLPLYIDGTLNIARRTLRSPNHLYIGGDWITNGMFERI